MGSPMTLLVQGPGTHVNAKCIEEGRACDDWYRSIEVERLPGSFAGTVTEMVVLGLQTLHAGG
jgi:hypothetical protein